MALTADANPLVVPPLLVADLLEGFQGLSLIKDSNGNRNLITTPGRQVNSAFAFSSDGTQTQIVNYGEGAGACPEALFIYGGSLISPTRFMTEAEEIRMEIVRLELRWTNYIPGLKQMLAVMNFLIGAQSRFPVDKQILDFNATSSGPIASGPNEAGYWWFMANYMMKYSQRYEAGVIP